MSPAKYGVIPLFWLEAKSVAISATNVADLYDVDEGPLWGE